MENKKQYDSYLKGNIELPGEINVLTYASARLEEITALENAIKKPKVTKRSFQLLPRHMRRRIMSHSTKRVPRRIREIHQHQLIQSGLPVKKKRPSRKFRRHPMNLLLEYERRQRLNVWLETHIWHAKRFHMMTKWGYKLPKCPADKNFKACYRATTKHCLLQDISYFVCIELQGPQSELLNGLKHLVSPLTGLTFRAAHYLDGDHYGNLTLFKKDKYPRGAIGQVNFFWKPKNDNNIRTLWIWLHPSCQQEAIDELITIFNLNKVDSEKIDAPLNLVQSKKLRRENIEALKLVNKNVPFERTPKYIHGDIKMCILKDTLNRFRLTGPLSHNIICKAFNVVNISQQKDKMNYYKHEIEMVTEENDWRINLMEEHKGEWISEYYNSHEKIIEADKQKEFWDTLNLIQESSQLPAQCILGFTIDDPRMSLPSKRCKAKIENIANQPNILRIPDEELNCSPIWESRHRDIASCSKPNNSTLMRLRNSGTGQPYPLQILLLQSPGIRSNEGRLGYGSGWDIIIPAGWAMPVWMSLILRGARVGGVREMENIALESGICLWNPDTASAKNESLQKEKELIHKYFKKPPNKRVNYRKLRVTSPFRCQWEELLQHWLNTSNSINDFYVLRDRDKLNKLNEMLKKKKNNIDSLFKKQELQCLVPVTIKMTQKGLPTDLAIIALPENEDIFMKRRKKQFAGPSEQPGHDINEFQRKNMRKEHKLLLKQLRRRRQRGNANLGNSKDAVENYNEQMRKLWLPDDTISSSRRTMGWLTRGGFNFTRAKGEGIGYVTLPAFKALIVSRHTPDVLIRNPTSLQYYFARLSIRL